MNATKTFHGLLTMTAMLSAGQSSLPPSDTAWASVGPHVGGTGFSASVEAGRLIPGLVRLMISTAYGLSNLVLLLAGASSQIATGKWTQCNGFRRV